MAAAQPAALASAPAGLGAAGWASVRIDALLVVVVLRQFESMRCWLSWYSRMMTGTEEGGIIPTSVTTAVTYSAGVTS